MDELRVWLTRLAAPLAFLAAATVLVVVVQRALDERDGSAGTTGVEQPAEPAVETQTEGGDGGSRSEREFYRIRAGDTLEGIATQFETTVDELLLLNPDIDPLALEPGDRIRVA
jgi:LysM repeat protein